MSKPDKRYSKIITKPSDIEEIVNLTCDECRDKDLIMRYFGNFGDGPRFNPYDIITIPKGKYGNTKKNKNEFTTTVGIWVFNKGFIEPMADVLGYYNETFTAGLYKKINKKISYAVLENKLTLQQMKDFIMQGQIAMACCSALSSSHTEMIFDMNKEITEKKKELEKKYGEAIKNNDLAQIKNYENELIEFAKDLIKDDPCADMFNSGARSSWENNFKNMYLCRGPLSMTDQSYECITNSYMDGLEKKDFYKVNDAAVFGPYSRARKTVDGGYKEKQFTNASQHIKVLPPGSDCGTKRTLNVTLTKDNIDGWMYCFFVNSSGRLTEITSENRDSLIGKTVKMRFSALCENKKDGAICEKCMGSLYNRMGIKNVGLGVMIMMSALKNYAMKNFHDSTLSLATIDPKDVFGE